MSSNKYNKLDKYSKTSRFIHWLMAVVIMIQLCLGLWMTWYQQYAYYAWHKAIGLALFMMVIYRLYWRMINVSPHLRWLPKWQVWFAKLTHYLLYLAMIVMPISGWMMSSFAGKNVIFFGVDVTLPLAVSQFGAQLMQLLHRISGYVFLALIAIHILAALKHHFWDKDHILSRMLGH